MKVGERIIPEKMLKNCIEDNKEIIEKMFESEYKSIKSREKARKKKSDKNKKD
tara:strand:- start:1486 stop:1644 length:159 start_codon:yes stop_codon:yes gene_type:complete